MSICPNCKEHVTNGADQTRRGGIRYHKKCGVVDPMRRKPINAIVIEPKLTKVSPFKRLYQIFKERAELSKPNLVM